MSKKTLLKGIIAVSAATTMLFSTAFAAEISSTRTLYVKGSTDTVEVATTVAGLTVGDEVTYLAGEASDPVYINQYTAEKETETFKYKTTKISDLATTTVKMAKADASFANGQSIATDAEIADPEMFAFNVTINGVSQAAIEVIPTNVGATVNVPLTLTADQEIDTVKVNDVDATYVLGDGAITITHGVTVAVADDNTFDPKSANIVIATKEKEQEEVVYEAPAYKGGYKVADYEFTASSNDEVVKGPMYAIFADSSKLPEVEEYGVEISEYSNFHDSEYYASLAAKGGDFAVAIIEADSANVPSVVYARTYYKVNNGDGSLSVEHSDDVITINVLK